MTAQVGEGRRPQLIEHTTASQQGENTPTSAVPAASAIPALEARHLTKQYGAARVVDDVSLTLYRGEVMGLVGESGSGKSTVARMLLRLIEPTAGDIRFHLLQGCGTTRTYDLLHVPAKEMRGLRRRLAIVFQDPYAALNPRMTVEQILREPFQIHGVRPQQGIEARLVEMLEEVGLDTTALARYPHAFSGGQRQRINIARALALEPALLVLDEPVSALDVSVGAQVINLLRSLQQKYALTSLFISHSMPLVRYLCDRVAVMQHGRVVESGTWQQVCESPREEYTQRLLAATPEMPKGDER
jgi:ABC-type glutathione transport system ATPase component